MNVLGRILAICLGLIAGCYSPAQPDCGFACKRSGECPSDYFCAPDGICHRNGSPATLSCAADARIDSPRPIDAPPPDADQTPPAIFATLPIPGETGVATSTVVRVQFTEPVIGVDGTTFRVFAGVAPVNGTVESSDSLTWTFIPAAFLAPNQMHQVELTSGITDFNSNALSFSSFTFTTGT
jgi:hypothetical protein